MRYEMESLQRLDLLLLASYHQNKSPVGRLLLMKNLYLDVKYLITLLAIVFNSSSSRACISKLSKRVSLLSFRLKVVIEFLRQKNFHLQGHVHHILAHF